MPELPEIETIKHGIKHFVQDKIIKQVLIRNSKLRQPVTSRLPKLLTLQRIKKIARRGKYLILYFKHGSLLIHLGMSGSLSVTNKNKPLKKHDHVDICFDDDTCLRFNDPRKFGLILWVEGDPLRHDLLCKLGVEPLAKEFTAEYLFSKIKHRKAAIKLLLMDSKIVAGIGNIYANEILFKAKIHPSTPGKNVSRKQCGVLVRAIKKVLIDAIKAGGTSIKDYRQADGRLGNFQLKLFVYGRQNLPCRICQTTLCNIRLGQRTTIFCPRCQRN